MTKKKILIGIAVLIIVALGAVVLENYRAKKIVQERERSIAKCREEVSEMTDEQIIARINTIPVAPQDIRNINISMANHLKCELLRNPFKEKYNIVKPLIDMLNISEETKRSIIDRLDGILQIPSSKGDLLKMKIDSPIAQIIIADQEKVCPDGKEDSRILEELVNEGARLKRPEGMMKSLLNMTENYCNQLSKYANDTASLANEVYAFKDWSAESEMREAQCKWKATLALRFGGEERAREVCQNLSQDEEVKNCEKFIDSFWIEPIISIVKQNCIRSLSYAKNSLCEIETEQH